MYREELTLWWFRFNNRFAEEQEAIERAVEAGRLTLIASNAGFHPTELISWAGERFPKFPFCLEYKSDQAPDPSDSFASPIPSAEKRRRPDALSPLIKIAQDNCPDPLNTASIYAELQKMASQKLPPVPLLGVTDEGIKWQDPKDEVRFLSKKSLSNRLGRQKPGKP
jgi:hypothetical protein